MVLEHVFEPVAFATVKVQVLVSVGDVGVGPPDAVGKVLLPKSPVQE